MLLFRNLSFRYKIPLRATILVLVTAFTITGAIIAREYDQLRQDLFANAESLGRVLAHNLITPLLHDDVWRAYEIINTPFQAGERTTLGAQLIMVLDPQGRIYASTRPFHYPIYTQMHDLGPEYAALAEELSSANPGPPRAIELSDYAHFHLVAPIVFDGVLLGSLVMEYPKSMFIPRFMSIVYRAGIVTLLVLLVLLPTSWYWGRRMAEPLIQLADCMGMVRQRIPDQEECRLYESRDEIGRAGAQLKRMLADLRQKEQLETSMLATERLAAVGRLTAGIAHEINNPLGGMLNAISTYKRHGQPAGIAARTVSLLERGLLQIKQTVAALLVEARLENRALTPQDLDDILTLALPDAHRKDVRIHWINQVTGDLLLPSTQVRQALLNLLLNAVQASDPNAEVTCEMRRDGDALWLRVINGGAQISAERMAHLFEPFSGSTTQGSGLGLWVTYQLVQQMDGRIEVESTADRTVFSVTLPVRERHAA